MKLLLLLSFTIAATVASNCNGGDSCCSAENRCTLGDGDCDSDDECAGDLVCGDDNCFMQGQAWNSGDDCCVLRRKLGRFHTIKHTVKFHFNDMENDIVNGDGIQSASWFM